MTSCSAPMTVKQLRNDFAGKIDIEVDQRYQDVFANVLKNARHCYFSKPLLTHQLGIKGLQNKRDKTANVAVTLLYGATSTETHLSIDMTAVSAQKTQITTYYTKANTRQEAERVNVWIIDGPDKCVDFAEGSFFNQATTKTHSLDTI